MRKRAAQLAALHCSCLASVREKKGQRASSGRDFTQITFCVKLFLSDGQSLHRQVGNSDWSSVQDLAQYSLEQYWHIQLSHIRKWKICGSAHGAEHSPGVSQLS